MLICPQCQFENPNSNKFCQRCGTSLIYKVCPKCGNNVAFSEQQCQNCGTVTGTVWLAIIGAAISTESAPQTSRMLPAGAYLDAQQRYQLLEPLPPSLPSAVTTEVQVRVLDCQPFQVSPLTAGADSMIAMSFGGIAKTYLNLQSQLHQGGANRRPLGLAKAHRLVAR